MSSSVGNTSSTRLSGLVSGMDTDALVKQMLAADTAKVTKLEGNIQLDEWRTEAYREVTSSLQSFYSTYFDPLSSSNLKTENSFSNFTTSYGATTSTNYVSVTGGANATAGTYSIIKTVAATSATLSGSNISLPVIGSAIGTVGISSEKNNNIFVLTLNNVTKQITLDGSEALTMDQYKTKLEGSINSAFGEGKIKVEVTGGQLKLSSVRSTDSFSIGTAYNDGASELFSAKPTEDSKFTLSESNNKFQLTIGEDTQTVIVPLVDVDGNAKTTFSSAVELADAIRRGANTAFGGTANIAFSGISGKVTYTSPADPVSIAQTQIDANAALGLTNSSLSNKVDLNAKLFNMTNAIGTTFGTADTYGNDIQFTINGTYFKFNSKETSLQDIMDKVNANTSIKATMKYDTTTNSFKIQSTGSGVTDKLTVKDVEGKGTLMGKLGVVGTDIEGTDASVTLLNGTVATTIVRSSNSFTYDGLTYEIKQDYTAGIETDIDTGAVTLTESGTDADPIVATVSTNTTKTYDYIKGFVDKYNELITKINAKMTEKKYRDYAPLTKDEKTSMSEDQIKQWEIKAKSGLLKNDSILSGVISKMRSALYDAVEGAGITLSSIGITTSSDYTTKGKLEIDEKKLKEALATKSEQITKLFTSTSDKTYYESLNSSTNRNERYKESGIAQRFSDVIQDAIRTNTDNNGNKGTLLDKAGIVGDRSEYTNLIFKEMASFDETVSEMNRRLTARESALYARFTAMESALSKMNEQQSYITQMLGSS